MSSPATEEREYVLGTHDAELTRLGFQHQVWSAQTAAAWEHAGFRRRDTILDVGCGPGYATLDLVDLVGPEGRVIGVDVSQRFVTHLREQAARRDHANVEARVEDLTQLSQAPASVDGAFARWVLCFVADPAAVVARVARALRPGGTFVAMDYCHYEGFRTGPDSDVVQRVFAAVARSWRDHGGEPDIGLQLPQLMTAAGLKVREVRPLVRIGRPGTALWEWPRTFFQVFLPMLVSDGRLDAADADAFFAEYERRSGDPSAWFMTPPMVEVVAVK